MDQFLLTFFINLMFFFHKQVNRNAEKARRLWENYSVNLSLKFILLIADKMALGTEKLECEFSEIILVKIIWKWVPVHWDCLVGLLMQCTGRNEYTTAWRNKLHCVC